MASKKTRGIAAIMFTDIVGYTAMMQKDEVVAMTIRNHHRAAFQKNHKEHHGEIIQYYGDGTLSTFSSAVKAVACAIAIQQALQNENPVPLRIGLHLGDIVFDGTEVYGDGVNLASRIERLGVAGAVLLSGKLNDELKNQPQFVTKSLGFFELKNIAKPVEVFAVANKGIKIPERSELKGVPKKETKTITVLPFVNMSSDTENEYFSDGMTEEIINALAKIRDLKVTSRTSSFHFKNKNIPISKIGEALIVSTILEGSIRLSGNKMRITAQLIDVADDFHFWSETFDRSVDDIFAVQDEISLLIADKLREHIGHFDIDNQLVPALDISAALYKKYLEGKYHLMKLDVQGTEKAISIFEEVIAQQPDFTLAYLGVNQGYAFLGTMGLIPAYDAFIKAKPFLDKAIELDENLPEVQLNLAWISGWQKWDLKAAYEHLAKAIESQPTDVMYLTMANFLTVEGKFDAAFNFAEKALELDPFAATNQHYKGFLYYLKEDFNAAKPYFEKALKLKPDFSFPLLYIGTSLILQGQAEEGLTFFKTLNIDSKGDLTQLGGTTLAHAALGNTKQLSEGLIKLQSALKTDAMGSAVNFIILINAFLGKHDEAIAWVEKGFEHRLPMMLLLNTEPVVKKLRSVPRFQELMQQALGDGKAFKNPKRKYKKSLLDKKELKQYHDRLDNLMLGEEPYLDPDLTLRNLAELLEIPPNHVSQLLNEGFDKNFSEFVNSYRLATFKSKVADPSQRHLTILALAYDSGFNSKTVFNTYFKKAMGITPRAYWKVVIAK